MRLIEARVENFKCVEDSGAFRVDQVTCLVGKNEAGKTALLEALYKLNPVEKDKADFAEVEYPRRHLIRDRQHEEQEPANVVTTTWKLQEADLAVLEEVVGAGVIKNHEVTLTKDYDNEACWTIEIDEQAIVSKALAEAKLNAAEKASLAKMTSVRQLIESIKEMGSPTPKHSSLLLNLGK